MSRSALLARGAARPARPGVRQNWSWPSMASPVYPTDDGPAMAQPGTPLSPDVAGGLLAVA